jgi:hypothetical protein
MCPNIKYLKQQLSAKQLLTYWPILSWACIAAADTVNWLAARVVAPVSHQTVELQCPVHSCVMFLEPGLLSQTAAR